MPKFIDLTGQTFGRLTVLERVQNNKHKQTQWKCRCKCGNISIVTNCNLRNNSTKSCGCLNKETIIKRNSKHGMAHMPEYQTWLNMLQRCYNSNREDFHLYGGRNISVCEEWKNNFKAFYDYIGPRPSSKHSIDRINNNGNYEPNNIRWALPKEQGDNTRSNHPITIDGITLNLCQWAKKTGIKRQTIYYRIRNLGWPPKKAIFQPIYDGSK